MNYLLYFAVGFILDILATIDIIAVQEKKAMLSAVTTFTLTFAGYYFFSEIILSPDRINELLSYALGGAAGAYLVIKNKDKCLIIFQKKKDFRY